MDTSKLPISRVDELISKLDEINNRLINLENRKYIIETWNEGTEWYRIWSDGWIEQGGQSYNAVDSEITIQLHKPYTNSDYFITQTTGFNGAWSQTVTGWHIPATIVSVTNSSFVIHFYSGNGLNIRRWYTCGY
nr:MAG TPA: hypothetical protein [Caudoviricetes sp.]